MHILFAAFAASPYLPFLVPEDQRFGDWIWWLLCLLLRPPLLLPDSLSFTGHRLPKPDMILQLEKGKEPWLVEKGVYRETSPGENETGIVTGNTWLTHGLEPLDLFFCVVELIYLLFISLILLYILVILPLVFRSKGVLLLHENYRSVNVLGFIPVHRTFLIVTTNSSTQFSQSSQSHFLYLCISFPFHCGPFPQSQFWFSV